jgi:putative polyhydroxyalkanoate system protein
MAQPLTVTISHKLTRQEAVRRLQNGIARIRNKGGVAASIEDEWTGDSATFKATALFQTISGRVQVLDDAVRVEVDLPWLLSRVSEKVKKQIEQRGTKMLSKPKA